MSDTNAAGEKYRYERHTWPEIDEAVADGKLLLVPTACVEDHGPHLPLDVDIELAGGVCRETAKTRDDTLVYPVVRNGYDPHHTNFPGVVSLHYDTFVSQLIDIGVSLAHHGFRKLLFVNGHGSNHHLVESASRQLVVQYPGVQAAMLSWWQIEEVHEALREVGEGGPQGSAHAGELETSVYMYLHPDAVDVEKAPRDVSYPESRHFNQFSEAFTGEKRPGASTPVTMMEWWSTISETGVMGDATVASEEKGERFLEAAVEGLDSVLEDFAEYPIREPEDHHEPPRAPGEFDPFRPR